MSDSDVFVISIVQDADPARAAAQAVAGAGVNSSRVQDVIFGLAEPRPIARAEILGPLHLECPTAAVSPALRAVFTAAQSIWSASIDVALVIAVEPPAATAMLLVSPDAVGRWNLMPRARLAGCSLAGVGPVLRAAGLEAGDVTVSLEGQRSAALIRESLEALEQKPARWATVAVDELALLIERI